MDIAVPLRSQPSVVQVGLNVHGRKQSERFVMKGIWGLHLYHYSGKLSVAGTTYAFSSGDITITPPDTELRWSFPSHAPHHYAHVAFPHHSTPDKMLLPVLAHGGGRAAALALGGTFDAAIASFAQEPTRATAWCWNLLWQLVPHASGNARVGRAAGVPGVETSDVHPALQTCLRIIDLELDRSLGLSGLAMRTGISVNQLLRLFHQQVGMTVMTYIRQRRAERARHLLENSSLPLIDIAAAVGVGTFQRLNKLMTVTYGQSPRSIRFAALKS